MELLFLLGQHELLKDLWLLHGQPDEEGDVLRRDPVSPAHLCSRAVLNQIFIDDGHLQLNGQLRPSLALPQGGCGGGLSVLAGPDGITILTFGLPTILPIAASRFKLLGEPRRLLDVLVQLAIVVTSREGSPG